MNPGELEWDSVSSSCWRYHGLLISSKVWTRNYQDRHGVSRELTMLSLLVTLALVEASGYDSATRPRCNLMPRWISANTASDRVETKTLSVIKAGHFETLWQPP